MARCTGDCPLRSRRNRRSATRRRRPTACSRATCHRCSSRRCEIFVAGDVTPWLERRFRAFFNERAAAQHTDTFLHKFTGWPRAGFIRGVFPSARFIHVVRDGRAVANSWLQMPWWLGFEGPDHWQWGPLPADLAAEWDESGQSFVVLAGLLWKMLIDAFDSARTVIPAADWLESALRGRRGQPA